MHRTASVNEYSTRYAQAIDSMAVTAAGEWRLQSTDNKQGSGGFVSEWPAGDDRTNWPGHPPYESPGQWLSHQEAELQKHASEIYQERLKFGVAREQARKDLPLSNYTEAYWKIDLHNLLHFLGLRMDSHAQLEIRQYATAIGEEIVAKLFPQVWEAFCDYRLGGLMLNRFDILMIERLQNLPKADRAVVFEAACGDEPFSKEKWTSEKSRERHECCAKLKRLGIL